MKPIRLTVLFLFAILAGCGSLDTLQSRLIFQPSNRQRPDLAGNGAKLGEIWLNFRSTVTNGRVRLHALWHPAPNETQAPVALYLHGTRWDVVGSAFRIRQLQAMGFSVLGIDYRGFGQSDPTQPSESLAYEDAEAAWRWLAQRYPERRRFIYGHSLGGAIAIELASRVDDESGTMVEGTFTSIPDVFSTLRFGWLPMTSNRLDQCSRLPAGRSKRVLKSTGAGAEIGY
ncbi:alpha/beta hydrolase [Azonexus sp. IMCC34842]|uniref:alpha/beta hydrolase n=1 Tax=Azonexus sp. IMCC34842 TaxID=3420950 RepID=UPI003D132F9C